MMRSPSCDDRLLGAGDSFGAMDCREDMDEINLLKSSIRSTSTGFNWIPTIMFTGLADSVE